MSAGGYRLIGGESQNLQRYVGQRVEVTGTLAGAGASTSGSSTTGAGASSTGAGTSSTGAGSTGSTGAGAGARTGADTGASASAGSQGQGSMPALNVTSVRAASGGGSCSQ
jgi:hypothetical protein